MELIETGGYSRVYKVNYEGAVVAAKRYAYYNVASATREMTMLKELKHENVVKFIDVKYGEMDGVVIYLELCECDLMAVIPAKPSSKLIKLMMRQLLRGLRYLHSRDIVHCDLKPENVLVKEGVLKIADFGQAHRLYTGSCERLGTLNYRAPEMFLTKETPTFRIDVWGFGCILAEMYTANLLFPGDRDVEVLSSIASKCGDFDPKTWPAIKDYVISQKKEPLCSEIEDDVVLDLIRGAVTIHPSKRFYLCMIEEHPYFAEYGD